MAVYPSVLLPPAGLVLGEITVLSPCLINVIEGSGTLTTGNLAVAFGRVTNLYLIICVSSGKASNRGILSIITP